MPSHCDAHSWQSGLRQVMQSAKAGRDAWFAQTFAAGTGMRRVYNAGLMKRALLAIALATACATPPPAPVPAPEPPPAAPPPAPAPPPPPPPAAPQPQAQSEKVLGGVKVSASMLNVRSAASTTADVVAHVRL